MKTSLTRFFAGSLILVLSLVPRFLARACGPDLGTDGTRFALFNPASAGAPSLEPFYYNMRFLNSYSADPGQGDYKRNCAEWAAWCGGSVTARDVFSIQYETEPDDFLYAAAAGNWTAFRDNSFVRYLLQPQHKAELDYMIFAKKAEANLFNDNHDPWRGNDPFLHAGTE